MTDATLLTGSFTKLDDGSWGIKVEGDELPRSGDPIRIVKRNGDEKNVVVGDPAGATRFGSLFTIAEEEHPADDAFVVEPGVFEVEGDIYVVKPNREKSRLYAKRLVESADRLTEEDSKVDFEFEYAPGAMKVIREEHRMPFARATALATRYGRCINCGRHLKAAKSVEEGIGPVCRRRFRDGIMPPESQDEQAELEALTRMR